MTFAPDCTGCREDKAQLSDLIRLMNRARYGPKSKQLEKLAVLKSKIATCRGCGTGVPAMAAQCVTTDLAASAPDRAADLTSTTTIPTRSDGEA